MKSDRSSANGLHRTATRAFQFAARGAASKTFANYAASASTLLAGVVLQFVTFIALARMLGLDQFGTLMIILAVTNVAYFLCGLGAGDTIIRRVARDPSEYPRMLGHSLLIFFASSAVLMLVVPALLLVYLQAEAPYAADFTAVTLIVFSTAVCFRFVTMTEHTFLAHSRFAAANFVNFGYNVSRALTAVVTGFVLQADTIAEWAMWSGAVHVALILVCIGMLSQFGAPKLYFDRREFRLGIHFTTPWFFYTLWQNADLFVLSLVVPHQVVGVYSAARKLMSGSQIAVTSLNRVLYPRLSVAGREGPRETLDLIRRYLVYILGFAVLASTVVFAAAPVVPFLFGAEFGDSIFYLQVFSWSLILIAAQRAAYEALGAADHHGARAATYNATLVVSSLVVAVGAYVWQVPGAIVGIYISEFAAAAVMWATLLSVSRTKVPSALNAG
jgi:O-antigen/teichoic acid export membrane protein